jgi:succinate dehydrogenase/fumarate reductase-like Fe-S protein
MSRPRSYAYLTWRAAVAHPLRRLGERGTALERFLGNYGSEGLLPTRPEDLAAMNAASACISCGICESACPLAGLAPALRDLGLHAAFRLYARSAAALEHGRDALQACAACTGCEPLCPTGVPIGRLVRYLAARASDGRDAPRQDPGPPGR